MSHISVIIFYDGTWNLSNEGTWRYQNPKMKITYVKRNSTFAELQDVIYNALNLDSMQYHLTLKFIYHICLSCEPYVVNNNNDVKAFIDEYTSHRPQDRSPLFVDVSPRVPQLNSNDYRNRHGTPPNVHGSIFASGSGSCSVATSNIPTSIASLSEVPEAAIDIPEAETQFQVFEHHVLETETRVSETQLPDDDVRNVVHNRQYESFEMNDLNEYGRHDYENDVENGVNNEENEQFELNCLNEDSLHGGAPHNNRPIGNIYDADIDDGNIPRGYMNPVNDETHNDNPVHICHGSTSSVSVAQMTTRCESLVNVSDVIKINQLFSNKKELKKNLCLYAMRRNFEFKVKKSDKVRYVVVCVDDNCKWQLRATKVKGENTDFFMIRGFEEKHTCSLHIMITHHRQTTSSVIGDIIKPKYDGIARQYKPHDIVHDMRSEYGVNLSYGKAWTVRECALSSLWGTPEESYANLPLWSSVLKRKNPRTFTRIETDSQNRFVYFFMALGASIRGFHHMRPVVAVDGTTLKNRYKGVLYIAACLDGNEQIYPLAFGIGPRETDAAYTWFFERFKEAFGEDLNLSFVTDRHKSIAKAIRLVFPNTYHGHCMYHLGMNLRAKKLKGDVSAITTLLYEACRAYIVEDFDKSMTQLERVSWKAAQYLKEANPTKWARSHFPSNRYSVMTTNIVESMNAVLLDARDKPVVSLLDHIRDLMQKWWYERRNNAAAMATPVTEWLETILQKRSNDALGLRAIPLNLYEFQVVGGRGGLLVGEVNLERKTCTCKEFDIDGFPCLHAFAACKEQHISPYTLCSAHFSIESLRSAYSETIYPLGDKRQWHAPDDFINQIVLPPELTKRSGRPRKKRIASQGEDRTQSRCGRCRQIGHSRRACSVSVPLDSM